MSTQPTRPAPRRRRGLVAATAVVVISGMLTLTACDVADEGDDGASTSAGDTQVADTPDQVDDLQIGTPVTIAGVTVTVDSVQPGQESTLGKPTLEVAVTYKNNSGSLLTVTPYDWSTVLRTGSDKAHVGGDVSFSLDNLSDGEEWSGIVTLWGDDDPQKVKFESSSINLGKSSKAYATWLLPQA